MTASLVVAETFGPTVQGEGPSTGRLAAFVRLGGCNLRCTWCDTPYTWDASRYLLREELTRRPVADIVAAVTSTGATLVVITGGEPLLHQHQPGWVELLVGLTSYGMDVEVETNGTITPDAVTVALVTRFNVSPKLAHAGDPLDKRIRPATLDTFTTLARTGRACFKFVCEQPGDVAEVDRIVTDNNLPRPAVWLMPEGTNADGQVTALGPLADAAITHGFNVSTRLHVAAWGNQRGR